MMGNRHRGRLANRDFTERWSRGYRFIARSRGKVKRAMRRNVRRSAKQSRYSVRERADSCGRTMLERQWAQWSWEAEYECPE